MDFSSIPLFNIMKTKLNYLSERQGILAQNIANADTPGYKAKDLSAPDFSKLVSQAGQPVQNLRMASTNAKHMTGNGATGSYKIINRGKTDELNPDGNNVSVEDEMSKVAANQADYMKTLNLYTKAISMFKSAIGVPNNG